MKKENKRLTFNRKLLSKISTCIRNNPDLRFGQILCILNINEIVHAGDFVFIKDNWNEESEAMYNRINKSNKTTAHRLS